MEVNKEFKRLSTEDTTPKKEDEINLKEFEIELTKKIKAMHEKPKASTERLYSVKTHWRKMVQSCKRLSKECTRTGACYANSEKLTMEACKTQMTKLINSVYEMVVLFNSFPETEGRTLHGAVQLHMQSIVHAARVFMNSVGMRSDSELQGDTKESDVQEPKDHKITVGMVWEACEKFELMSKDNCAIAEKKISSNLNLVADAISEVKLAIEEHDAGRKLGDDSADASDEDTDEIREAEEEDERKHQWSESDRQLLKPCVAILTAARGLLSKCSKAVGALKGVANKNNNNDIDDLTEAQEKISESVDSLILLMYPPISYTDLRDKIVDLKKILEEVLLCCRSSKTFGTQENLTWIEFIQKALDHNLGKLNSQIPGMSNPTTTTTTTDVDKA